MSPWPHGDPRDVARAIVADPRFGGTTAPEYQPNLLERFLRWLGERLAPLFGGIGRLLGSDSPWNRALGLGVILLIAVGLLYLVWRIFGTVEVRRRSERPAAVPFPATETGQQLRARALAAARDERWHDAASLLFVSALRALDERGRLAFDPARTAGEARRALRDRDFDALAREGTSAIFAADAATAERFARMNAAYVRLLGDPG